MKRIEKFRLKNIKEIVIEFYMKEIFTVKYKI